MSTRATYQIEDMTFYCHHDGYPEYAAVRFARMIAAFNVPAKDDNFREIEDRRGSLMFAFVRGNLDAQPTESHDAHGDTEWRYTIRFCQSQKLWTVLSEARNWESVGPASRWRDIQCIPLDQFIADHGADFEAEPVVQFHFESGTHIATAKAAAGIAHNLGMQADRLEDSNPNKARYAARAAAWAGASVSSNTGR